MKKTLFMIFVLAISSISFFMFFKKNNKSIKVEEIKKVEVIDKKDKEEIKQKNLYDDALTYMQAGESKEATRVWRQIINEYPKSKYTARACYELGKNYLLAHKKLSAAECFKKVIVEFNDSEYSGYALYELALLDEEKNDLAAALEKYKKIKENYFFIDNIEDVIKKIETLNIKLIFSPKKTQYTVAYSIKPGDTIFGIAKKFNNTVDYILEANNIQINSVIHPGNELKLLNNNIEFSLIVDKTHKNLTLKMNDEIIKNYKIAIGKENSTPVGEFAIQNKLKDPVWFTGGQAIPPDDPKNILGSRWLGFLNDLGIHGTIEKKEITQQETSGCIRMYNQDVEELFKLLRIGDKVIIKD